MKCSAKNKSTCRYHGWILSSVHDEAYARLQNAQEKMSYASHGDNNSAEYNEATKELAAANRDYNSTPEGLDKLKSRYNNYPIEGEFWAKAKVLSELEQAETDWNVKTKAHNVKAFLESEDELSLSDIEHLFADTAYEIKQKGDTIDISTPDGKKILSLEGDTGKVYDGETTLEYDFKIHGEDDVERADFNYAEFKNKVAEIASKESSFDKEKQNEKVLKNTHDFVTGLGMNLEESDNILNVTHPEIGLIAQLETYSDGGFFSGKVAKPANMHPSRNSTSDDVSFFNDIHSFRMGLERASQNETLRPIPSNWQTI